VRVARTRTPTYCALPIPLLEGLFLRAPGRGGRLGSWYCTLLRIADRPWITFGAQTEEGEALMITVTAQARELLRSYERLEGTVLRLDPANGHSSEEDLLARLRFGEPREDDQVLLDREGEELLRIERSVSEELNGSEMDVVNTIEGPTLDLKRPTHTWPLTDDS
jgi:hypothetical protein